MAGKKKIVPRHSRTVEHRADKQVSPKGKVTIGLERVVIESPHIHNPDGTFNRSLAYDANQRYGGKKWGVEFSTPAIVYRPAHLYTGANGFLSDEHRKRIRDLDAASGKKTQLYEVPPHAPSKGTWLVEEREKTERKKKIANIAAAAKAPRPKTIREITSHPTLPHVKIRKVYSEVNGVRTLKVQENIGVAGRVLRTEGEARLYSQQQVTKAEVRALKDGKLSAVERSRIERRHRDIAAEFAINKLKSKPLTEKPKPAQNPAVKPSKTVVPKAITGSRYVKGTKLRLAPSQIISSQGIVRNVSFKRRLEMAAAQAKREWRRLREQARQEYKWAIRRSKHQAAQARRRVKELLRQPLRRAARAQKLQATLVRQIRGFQQSMPKTPLPLLLKGRQWAAGRSAAKAARTLTHAERYPAVGHAGPSPMQTPVDMRPVSGKMSLTAAAGRSKIAGTKLMATQTTLPGRGPGQGIFFRVNVDAVVANLTQRYPQAMAVAARGAAKTVGRKLLDIVEPYVPKDTGLMYTTAQTNSDMTSDGLVDIDGAEPYPSAQMFGVSISYNTPYAEEVYFNMDKAHGKAYNAKHNTNEKGEKEVARWIEAAFSEEGAAVQNLLGEYAQIVTAAFDALPNLSGGHHTPRRR